MSKFSYLKFLVVFVVGYIAVRVLFLEDELSFETVLDSAFVGMLAVIFTFVYERIRVKSRSRNHRPE